MNRCHDLSAQRKNDIDPPRMSQNVIMNPCHLIHCWLKTVREFYKRLSFHLSQFIHESLLNTSSAEFGVRLITLRPSASNASLAIWYASADLSRSGACHFTPSEK